MAVEQQIRFCPVDGRRLAYATLGEGPALVFPTWWISHLELDWEDEAVRAFFAELAQTHRVVRYDRLGAGLSDRELDEPPSYESEVRALGTLIDHLADGPVTLFSLACAGPIAVHYASRQPERVHALVFYNSFAARDDVADEVRESLVSLVRASWGLGSHMLASLFLPEGGDIRRLSRFQRQSASAEAAAAFLELELTADVRPLLPSLEMPALVLHRRNERTVPFALGRELAALLPGARFVPLAGREHFMWSGDTRDALRALAGFFDAPAPTNGDSPLSVRETEVLRLVAAGMSNREIASTLVVSEHTVHRHVANILRKLAQSSRAGAAAQAARTGLI
jgi:pimeloyl-ACP methyl ester carboxylesterase